MKRAPTLGLAQKPQSFIPTLLDHLEANKHALVIDADVHATNIRELNGEVRERYVASPDYHHGRSISAEDILAEMREHIRRPIITCDDFMMPHSVWGFTNRA